MPLYLLTSKGNIYYLKTQKDYSVSTKGTQISSVLTFNAVTGWDKYMLMLNYGSLMGNYISYYTKLGVDNWLNYDKYGISSQAYRDYQRYLPIKDLVYYGIIPLPQGWQ